MLAKQGFDQTCRGKSGFKGRVLDHVLCSRCLLGLASPCRLDIGGPWRPHYGLLWELQARPRMLKRWVPKKAKGLPEVVANQLAAVDRVQVAEIVEELVQRQTYYPIKELNVMVENHTGRQGIEELTVA